MVMPDLNDLYLYVQVVDHRGFAPAGRALSMPKSRLSRRIALLEERLGVRLIQRSTRSFSVTDIGQEYYGRCVAMLVEADSAQELIERAQSAPRGSVKISCPIALLNARVAPMLTKFMTQCPEVQVHLEASNRQVDVIREGFDIALRARFPPLEDSELVARTLAQSVQFLVASPDCIVQHGLPRVPADLATWPSLDLGPPQRQHEWSLRQADGAMVRVMHHPRLVTDDMATLRGAALAGLGAVLLPDMVVQDDLDAGRLVLLLPEWPAAAATVQAVFPSRRGLIPAVRALLDFLVEEFAAVQ